MSTKKFELKNDMEGSQLSPKSLKKFHPILKKSINLSKEMRESKETDFNNESEISKLQETTQLGQTINIGTNPSLGLSKEGQDILKKSNFILKSNSSNNIAIMESINLKKELDTKNIKNVVNKYEKYEKHKKK